METDYRSSFQYLSCIQDLVPLKKPPVFNGGLLQDIPVNLFTYYI